LMYVVSVVCVLSCGGALLNIGSGWGLALLAGFDCK
jgi:hypothetical protein